jgi:gas vesicle protein
MNKFKEAMIAYRNYKRRKALGEQEAPIEYTMAMLNDKVKFGLDIIKKDVRCYRDIIHRLDTAEASMGKQEETIVALNQLSKEVMTKVGQMQSLNLRKRTRIKSEAQKEAKTNRQE